MHTELPIKYIKLKNGEDLVTYLVNDNEEFVTVKRPLCFMVENDPMHGRQMLNVHEWMPPIVALTDIISIQKEFILFITDVKDEFKAEYRDIIDYLYGVTPRKAKNKQEQATVGGKVILFADLIKDPSGKPN